VRAARTPGVVVHWSSAARAGRDGSSTTGPCCRAGLKAQRLPVIRVTHDRALVTCKRCLATIRRDARSAAHYPAELGPEWKP